MAISNQPEFPARAVRRYNRQAVKNRCEQSGKLGYRTKRKALRVAERMRRHTTIRVYECRHCKLWHLTSLS